jgi:Na+-driven multidrug efflux pump
MVITSIIFIFFPAYLLKPLISAPEIIKEGTIYLRIIGYFELFLGWEIIFEGVFTGFGLTSYPMYFSLPLTLSRIPLAYYFAFNLNMGVSGVWWAISITTFLKGMGIGLLYWSGYSYSKKLGFNPSCRCSALV